MYRVFDTVCIVIRSEAEHLDAGPRGTPQMRAVGMEYAISLFTHEPGNESGLVLARYPHPDGAAGVAR
ncbi:hypothetical protein BX592_105139 [Paraburkholderia rhizosphaerae]|uniref:Uncharacterized protein n=1 Tax=Paraburkholderia rhizosphaerae TaxID=480658 RepID=A0A4V3HFC2_9BURK|nr:hypothetical protein BX592_105139 [Paraburkholderia rhizosphaerae]